MMRRLFAVGLLHIALNVGSSVGAEPQTKYTIVNRAPHLASISFSYCTGIIPENGWTHIMIKPGQQHQITFSANYPSDWCMRAHAENVQWLNHSSAILVMGNSDQVASPGTYALVAPPPAHSDKLIRVRPGQIIVVSAAFGGFRPQKVELLRDGLTMAKMESRGGHQPWAASNLTGSTWNVKIQQSFEQAYCTLHFIRCWEWGTRWMDGDSKETLNTPNQVRIGYDDYEYTFWGKADGDGDFNDSVVEVRLGAAAPPSKNDVVGWHDTKWGMTEQEVQAIFQQAGLQLSHRHCDVSDRYNPLVVATELSSRKARALPYFSKSGKVLESLEVWLDVESSNVQQVYEEIVEWATARYGSPFQEIGPVQHDWRFKSTFFTMDTHVRGSIRLRYFRLPWTGPNPGESCNKG